MERQVLRVVLEHRELLGLLEHQVQVAHQVVQVQAGLRVLLVLLVLLVQQVVQVQVEALAQQVRQVVVD